MRFFLYFTMLAVLLNADVTYVVQVLSVKDKNALTPEFMSKLKQIEIPHKVKYIDGEYKVFMGDFKTEQEAASRLPEIQEIVNPDAFVTMVEMQTGLKAEAKMQQMMVLAQARLLQVSKQEEAVNRPEKPLKKEDVKTDTVDAPGPQDKLVIRKTQTTGVVRVKDEGKPEETLSSEDTSQSLFCKPTKRALREAEISEALAFYKNSSYYTFDQGH